MCGILGVLGPDRARVEEAARRGLEAIRHRGPDDHGLCVFPFGKGFLALAHARLSILDLRPEGRQPMVRGPLPAGGRGASAPGDDGSAVLFNGEIYNFRALRKAHTDAYPFERFHSTGDTEILLHGLYREGEAFLPKLRGMFAFAYAEPAKRRLTLVRDRLGIKPLYWSNAGGHLVFGSEVRGLLATGLVERRLDPAGLGRLLSFGAAQDPDTLVSGVKSLLPGHAMTWDDGRLGPPRRWWSLPTEVDRSRSRAEWVHDIRQTLEETVALHLESDVPVGAFLSGGTDSSALVGLMARAQSQPVRTSIVVSRGDEEINERAFAEEVANRWKTRHSVEELTAEEAALRTLRSTDAMDLPSVDGANTYIVSEAIRGHGCTVALSGLGGDEIFLGYDSFARLPRLAQLGRIPGLSAIGGLASRFVPADQHVLQRAASLARTAGDFGALLLQQRLFLFPRQRDAVLAKKWRVPDEVALASALDPAEIQADPLNHASAFELRSYCQNMLLRDSDAMSMAHALELRVPFLDHVLVELLLRIPGEMKARRDGLNKPLLVDAVRELLPESVYRRSKRGFALAIPLWMRTSMKAEVERTLVHESAIFDARVLRAMWSRFLAGDDRLSSRLWGLFRIVRWLDRQGLA